MLPFTAFKLCIIIIACAAVQSDCSGCNPASDFNSAPANIACGELPACYFSTVDCGNCRMPECGVCGQNQCWDCSDEPGIDVDSLTTKAQSKKLYEASKARIVITVPEDAGVFLLDQRMSTLGAKRAFTVSVNDQSKVYKYEIKVDVVRGGKKYFKKLKIVDLRAGMILNVAVEAPPVPDGEPAQITIAAEALEKGGKPQEGEGEKDVENTVSFATSGPVK